MNRNKKAVLLGALASVTLLSGCSFFGGSESVDAPPEQAVSEYVKGIDPVSVGEQQNRFAATLYAEDEDGYVTPLGIKLPYSTTDFAKTTLRYMVKGGPVEELLPEGFQALLPEGTEVLSMDIDSSTRTATIDFNEAFTKYAEADERQILEAVTWAMTSFETIDNVELWVEGRALKEMPVARTPLNHPLSRKMGINVELSEGVNYGRATPVTLYFLNQTASDFSYYVPVTRLIEYTDDVAAATVAELAEGPADANKLSGVLFPSAAEVEVSVTGEGLVVDFDASVLASTGEIPSAGVQAVVLSLTETIATEGVRVTVDGQPQPGGSGAAEAGMPTVVNLYEM